MKLSRSVVVSLAVVFVGGLIFAYWAGDHPASDMPSAFVRTPASAIRNMPAETRSSGTQMAQQDMVALRQEVILLRREVARMQQQFREQQTASEVAAPVSRAEQQQFQRERMESLEVNFRQEVTDRQWAETASAAIQTALQGEGADQLVLQDMECHSHTCRLELANDGSGKLEKFLPSFLPQLSETLPYATANPTAGDGNLILYMSSDSGDFSQQGKQ